MITEETAFNQDMLCQWQACDPIVNKYRQFFAALQWWRIPERDNHSRVWPGRRPHPEKAYIKALLVKINEKKST